MQPKAGACQRKETAGKPVVSANTLCFSAFMKAERQGFETWVPVRVLRFSRPVFSSQVFIPHRVAIPWAAAGTDTGEEHSEPGRLAKYELKTD